MQNYVFDKEKFDIFEGMTSISSIIAAIQNNASKRHILKVLYNADKKKSKYNELKFLECKSRELGYEIIPVPYTVIDELANGKTHGGIVAICSKIDIPVLNKNEQIFDKVFYSNENTKKLRQNIEISRSEW